MTKLILISAINCGSDRLAHGRFTTCRQTGKGYDGSSNGNYIWCTQCGQ